MPKRQESQRQLKELGDTTMSSIPVNPIIQDEINRLAQAYEISIDILSNFAQFVIENRIEKPTHSLSMAQLKKEVYRYFEVGDTAELKRSGSFKMATDGMDQLNLSTKASWEILYRKFVGFLPGEEHQKGYGCINGINIFSYFKPWQVFGLDPKTATHADIKAAYHNLSKVYHPDVSHTGDSEIFERVNLLYKSITSKA